MENRRHVLCLENEDLASYIWRKRQEMSEAKTISERTDSILSKAYCSVCDSKSHIATAREFSELKGVGKWTVKLMQGFFQMQSEVTGSEQPTQKGKKTNVSKRYLPQKNSVAYALLITLYRGIANGSSYMQKQELINAAEASGLSRAPIAPEKGNGKARTFGSTPREWYSGWTCMKTLITKGLVVKSSCPAKYMLTQEGKEAAREILSRSGLIDSIENSCGGPDVLSDIAEQVESDPEIVSSSRLGKQDKSRVVPNEFLEKLKCMGYSEEHIHAAFARALESSQNQDSTSLWFSILFHLRLDQVESLHSTNDQISREECCATSNITSGVESRVDSIKRRSSRTKFSSHGAQHVADSSSSHSILGSFNLRACKGSDSALDNFVDHSKEGSGITLAMPPLRFGQKFEDIYDVILLLDDREHFAKNCGSRSRNAVESMVTQFKILTEVRRLPIGDGIWIARHKQLDAEYVLDFIVERKGVDDLHASIRDNRYRDQKQRLSRCGLQKLIYLVEGDPNYCEGAEGIKTACFTTEILEGFDVHRTSGLTDTLKKYGYLTQAITQYYRKEFSNGGFKHCPVCLSFNEFSNKCQDLDRMTVSDVFAVQLLQVPQVTEEVALAVLNMYPTILSLAQAYALLEGDVLAQEEMLKRQSDLISATASRNIYKFIWGSG